tara:strand:- start:449 stop:610 length:162 start_codon:yes stop_codon:yes gene_type:complete
VAFICLPIRNSLGVAYCAMDGMGGESNQKRKGAEVTDGSIWKSTGAGRLEYDE